MTVPQIFVHSYWMFVLERFGLGIFIGGVLPTANALVGRLSPPEDRGAVYGMTASATFLGGFFGPFTGGTVASLLGPRWVFVVTASVLFANLIWVLLAVPSPSTPVLARVNQGTNPPAVDTPKRLT
jgi:DHA1 family multidrug resistance protein-like MFS transporter